VFLYSSPVGSVGEFLHVDSAIPARLGKAYGKARIERALRILNDRPWWVAAAIVGEFRVETTIGDRRGFVAEPDLQMLTFGKQE
jgi:hypothetical protein